MWKTISVLTLLAVLIAACGTSPSGAPTVQPGAQPTAATTTQPGDQPTSAPSGVAVKIASFAFDPASVTIKAGTTVTWTNEDSAPHTITADDGSWDSGSLNKGQSFSQVFAQAGTFTYHCTIHPSMNGTIVVTQ